MLIHGHHRMGYPENNRITEINFSFFCWKSTVVVNSNLSILLTPCQIHCSNGLLQHASMLHKGLYHFSSFFFYSSCICYNNVCKWFENLKWKYSNISWYGGPTHWPLQGVSEKTLHFWKICENNISKYVDYFFKSIDAQQSILSGATNKTNFRSRLGEHWLFLSSVKNDMRRIERRGKIKQAVQISTPIQTIWPFSWIYDILW